MKLHSLLTLCLGIAAIGATAKISQADDYEDYLEDRREAQEEAREEYLERLEERREELRDRYEDRWEDRNDYRRGYIRPYGSYYSQPRSNYGYGFSRPYSQLYDAPQRRNYGYVLRPDYRSNAYSSDYGYRSYGTGYRGYRDRGWSLNLPGIRLNFND